MDEIKGAIFDLDGTLLDSLWVWQEIDKRFLARRGIEVPSDYARAIGTMNFRRCAEYTIERFKLDETPEQLMDEWMAMSQNMYRTEIGLKPFAREFLTGLKNRGIKLAIATSSAKDLYMPALIANNIADFFDYIADTSGMRGKDFPDVYLAAAEKLNLEPKNCAVFEDLPVALASAKQGGFTTVAICDRHTFSGGELLNGVDYVAQGFFELVKYL